VTWSEYIEDPTFQGESSNSKGWIIKKFPIPLIHQADESEKDIINVVVLSKLCRFLCFVWSHIHANPCF
jgi:hypothetical protein